MLDPRKLLSGHPARPRRPKRKSERVSFWRRLWRSRAWNYTHVLAVILAVAAVAAILYGFVALDFWVHPASTTISDNRFTPAAEIYQQAGIHGFSAFFIDPAAVAARVEQLPHVQKARVRVRLPARVDIQVVEREPMILYQVQGDSYWIDAAGVIMPAVEQLHGLIKLIDDDRGGSQGAHKLDPGLLQAILHVTGTIPEVTTFRFQEPYGLFFISPEGWRVYLGDASNMDVKLAEWETLRKKILNDAISVQEVDLRYSHPYWR